MDLYSVFELWDRMRIAYCVLRIAYFGLWGRPGAWWGSVVNPKLALRARGLTNPPTPLGGAGVVNPKIRTVTPGSASGLDVFPVCS